VKNFWSRKDTLPKVVMRHLPSVVQPLARPLHQLRALGQIPIGITDVGMPKIGGENGKPTLHVLSGTIPTNHGLNGKSVTKIVKAWTAIGRSMPQAGPSGEFIKCSSNCRHFKRTPEVGN
jgi:hypothetical protein